jgi:hypothetical protein
LRTPRLGRVVVSCCFKNDAVVKLYPSDERPQAAWDSVSRLAFTVVVAEAQGSFEVEGSCLLDLVRNWVDLEAVQSEHTSKYLIHPFMQLS